MNYAHLFVYKFQECRSFVLYIEKITQHTCGLPTGGKRTDVHLHYQTQKTFRTAMSDVLTITYDSDAKMIK
jgi:hypothetical protein